MECLHPYCPVGNGADNWEAVIKHPGLKVRDADEEEYVKQFEGVKDDFGNPVNIDISNKAFLNRLLELCPCLYSQIPNRISARGVVHLCEIALEETITSGNVCDAFEVQHPSKTDKTYKSVPLVEGAGGGDIMEALCSEVLTNEGVPHMVIDDEGWPKWEAPAHVSLNSGKFSKIKLYGDILIPAAPTNILISIKSEKTRERLIISGNRFESLGFGFFDEPSEFWSENRMKLYKRMGFTAIYMPSETLRQITGKLEEEDMLEDAININGTALYRDIRGFGADIKKVAGKITLDL